LRSVELITTVDPLLIETCVCPNCQGPLTWSATRSTCPECGQSFPIVDGIPVFAVLNGDEHKREQAELYFDARGEEWEIERPWGGIALYGWLMLEKFRRSIEGLEDRVPGATTLVVCAGSGMDAEFLARAGARVIASDLSLGAALRTRERALRHGVPLVPLVADAEALPFRDQGVDLTYVHDGLHHLRDPEIGLREMARVAGDAMSVSEPAQAFVTQVALVAGIALREEPAGNKVERLAPATVHAAMEAGGLRVIGTQRYAMFYRQDPGRFMRLMSRRRLLGSARAAINGFNASLGHVSNKLTVRAVRDEHR
jgi:SAM-dependent methyltransferase